MTAEDRRTFPHPIHRHSRRLLPPRHILPPPPRLGRSHQTMDPNQSPLRRHRIRH
eukprot:CCRYP_005818-RE/>CCRYP_005818-RE protein AED:0.48 eAED:0.48 QI:0/-1/0/1/-1/0/1/0/54